jgi:hypothetical protein
MDFHVQIVVGLKGVTAVEAGWMRLPKPKSVGQVRVGKLVAFFPDGHNFKPEVNYYLGNGVKSAMIPITPTRAYWFVC